MEQAKPTLEQVDKWTVKATLPEGAVVVFTRPTNAVKRMIMEDPEQGVSRMNTEEVLMAACVRSISLPADYGPGQPEPVEFKFDAKDVSNAKARTDELTICDLEALSYLFTREVYPNRQLMEEAWNDIKKKRAAQLGK